MELIKRNVLTILLLLLLIIVVVAAIVYVIEKPGQSRQAVDEAQQQYLVASISPNPLEALSPGSAPTFILQLTHPANPQSFDAILHEQAITQLTDNVALPTQIAAKNGNRTLVITSTASLKPDTQYTIVLLDKQTQDVVYQARFITTSTQTPRVATNNPALQKYLPYQEAQFELHYLPDQNRYVFNFVYNPDSDKTIDVQYNEARNQAIQFITSKGIDINSIVIDWRHS